MISPEINRAEGIRLLNELGMADSWVAITFNIKDGSFGVHSELSENDARVFLAAYIVNDEYLLNLLKQNL